MKLWRGQPDSDTSDAEQAEWMAREIERRLAESPNTQLLELQLELQARWAARGRGPRLAAPARHTPGKISRTVALARSAALAESARAAAEDAAPPPMMASPADAAPAIVHRDAESDRVAGDARTRLAQARGAAGEPLPDDLREELEAALGADLRGVRIHRGGDADAAARAIGARAYTTGQDIYFRDGTYDPRSPAGRKLIAHEVAHTRHGGGDGGSDGLLQLSQPGDATEHEADAFADVFAGALADNDRRRKSELDTLAAPIRAAAPVTAGAGGARIHRTLPGIDGVSFIGPEIRAADGTTPALQAERRRLVDEQSRYHHSTIEPDREQVFNMYTASISRLDTLLAERGDSTLPDSTVELRFDGSALTMSGTTSKSWPCVSGRPDAAGGFDNSDARQRQQNVGPIPAGVYWIDPSQMVDLQSRWFYSLRYEVAWGTHRITIHPFNSTATFGRGGFFIHGGTVPGSAGCIDLTGSMADFARTLGGTPPGCKVKLTVAY